VHRLTRELAWSRWDSFSSPIMAGIQLLVNQATDSTWGNPNTVYYQLANGEYGDLATPPCNSTLGTALPAPAPSTM